VSAGSAATDGPVPPELPKSLGRAAALGELDAVLAAATRAHGGLVLITGEAGIGKTTLASEAGDRAVALGITMYWSTCWTRTTVPPYWPWSQLVENHLSRVDAADLPELLAAIGPWLAAIAPDLASRMDIAPPDPPPDDRFALFQAVTRFWTVAAARAGPVLLVIDDLEHADPSSVHLLAHLTTMLLHAPVALLATVGTSEPSDPETSNALAELDRCAPVILALNGLPDSALAALIESAGVAPDASLVQVLAERTGGNPFFATELLRMLDRGQDGTVSIEALSTGVPRHVERAVQRRLARLDAPMNELLRAAAVIGTAGDVDALVKSSTLEPEAIWELLEEAADLGFIVHERTRKWRFAHTIVRDVVYRSLPIAVRRQLADETQGASAVGLADPTISLDLSHHSRSEAADDVGVFRREGSLWVLGFAGLVIRVPPAKGLADLGRLLAQPGQPIHVSELIALQAPGAIVSSGADEMFDAQARREIRQRLSDLAAEAEEAEADVDLSRAERARTERAELLDALSSALGLGGRARRLDDPLERARKTVSARIRSSIHRIEAEHPLLARHLERSIDTGLWCVYEPEQPVAWRT
jgi:hypothetical protein